MMAKLDRSVLLWYDLSPAARAIGEGCTLEQLKEMIPWPEGLNEALGERLFWDRKADKEVTIGIIYGRCNLSNFHAY